MAGIKTETTDGEVSASSLSYGMAPNSKRAVHLFDFDGDARQLVAEINGLSKSFTARLTHTTKRKISIVIERSE